MVGWFSSKFFLGKKIDRLISDNFLLGVRLDEIKTKRAVDDLERYREIKVRWEERQDSKGDIDLRSSDDKDVYDWLWFSEKYKDWISVDENTPPNEILNTIKTQIDDAIDLIRRHGYKKALKIRKGKR